MDLLINVTSPFKHLGVEILKKLDNQSLTRCRLVSKAFKGLIDEEKFYYLRQIKSLRTKKKLKEFFENYPDWKRIVDELDSKETLADLRNMNRFLGLFFKKVKKSYKTDPLQWIVSKNDPKWVKFILKYVQNVNGVTTFDIFFGLEFGVLNSFGSETDLTEDSWTPLMTACSEGYVDIVRILFVKAADKKLDLFKRSNIGLTAFLMAVEK